MEGSGTRVAVLSIDGTNCDEELVTGFRLLGADAEVVDLKQLTGSSRDPAYRRRLSDYHIVMFPGGFSAGDYVRAGAIMAARVRSSLWKDLRDFTRTSGNLVGGICNGFQVLVELGLLPGRFAGSPSTQQAILTTNASARFECRPTYVRWESGNFLPLGGMPRGRVFYFPSAHGEGRFVLSGEKGATLRELKDNGQILFRWTDPEGLAAGYPWNPNGSEDDVAGITNRDGNVFGLMPHPERAFDLHQYPDWTRRSRTDGDGDGKVFLKSLVDHASRKR
jgi:phosphoribosylformylglycinamidine synthase